MLERWRERDVFKRSLANREGAEVWNFYEGPPTANGRPGSHHVLARVFKDVYPRYSRCAATGCRARRAGTATGCRSRSRSKSSSASPPSRRSRSTASPSSTQRCRESVFEYVEEWNRLTERIGFWIDLDDPYVTLDDDYIESVWWSLKQLWDEDRLYEGHKVVPYCPRCGTALSSHEVALGYQDVEDPSIYVRFPLLDEDGGEAGESLLVWTTTPVDAARQRRRRGRSRGHLRAGRAAASEILILAEPLLERVLGEDAEVLERLPGSELVGRRYQGPVFELERREPGRRLPRRRRRLRHHRGRHRPRPHRPGLRRGRLRGRRRERHLRPDRRTARSTTRSSLDGRFDRRVSGFEGQFVKDPEVTQALIADLDARGLLFREQVYEHAYPHCWRCGTPLLYYAKSSWYVATSQVREQLLANNETIGWHPEHIKHGRFGKWLENNVDWALSRDRYWGTPLPIWECAERGLRRSASAPARSPSCASAPGARSPRTCTAPTSTRSTLDCEQLRRRDAPGRVGDRHLVRQRRDALRPAPLPVRERGAVRGALPRRLHLRGDRPDPRLVLHAARRVDPALRQSQLPQLRLPRPDPRPRGPEDVEEQGQRGRALGRDLRPRRRRLPLVLPDRAAALVGLPLLGRHGRRIGAPVPADALEHLLLLGPLRQRRGPRSRRLPTALPEPRHDDLDRWALSRLQATVATVRERMDEFDCTAAGRAIAEYVEELSNWYVRLSRRRFWDGDRAAFATLRHCLLEIGGAARPVHPLPRRRDPPQPRRRRGRRARRAPDSVHLRDFPEPDAGARRPRAGGGDGGGAPHGRARPRRPRPGQGQGAPAAAPRRDRRQRRRARRDRGPRRPGHQPSSTSRSSTSSPRRRTWSATRSSPTTARSARASASACPRSPPRSRRSTPSTSPR